MASANGRAPAGGSAVNADAWVAALERPRLTVRGRTYTGRLLSYPEWMPFEERIQTLIRAQRDRAQRLFAFREAVARGDTPLPPDLPAYPNGDDWHHVARDYCALAFPRPWYRRWAFWRRDVGELVLSLPPGTMFEVLQAFFGCQGRSNQPTTDPAPPTRTHGTPSPA